MTNRTRWMTLIAVIALTLLACAGILPPGGGTEAPGGGQFPPAEIQNDEGGPVTITGEVTYTNPFFTAGVSEPLVIMEDEGGFVTRDRNFIIPVASQIIGQITSDFFTSPFTYSISLPQQPAGTLRDVDNDGEEDAGVMVYAVAFWTNIWGDPYLEERDLYGAGWSSAYASTLVSDDRATYLEIYGGVLVIFAPDDAQGFPSSFGEDGLLFTEDDPIVGLPQGWTVVDLDSDPFTFDRSANPDIPLLEPESTALDDFSSMSYTEAFDAMLEKFRTEYAFTELKGIDWDALGAEFRPQFEQADANNDAAAYLTALRGFISRIPDDHVSFSLTGALADQYQRETAGGVGVGIRELDDGRVLVTLVVEDTPAADAGMQIGAEIITWNGVPIGEALDAVVPWSAPFSTAHTERLQQLRYLVRAEVGAEAEVTFRNPGGAEQTTALTFVQEPQSFSATSFYAGVTGAELPVEFQVLDNGYGYARVFSFFDNQVLTIQLWERMMETLNQNEIPGLILDMRQNGGGSGWLADQMAAYFFDERIPLGNTGYYDDSTGEFYFDTGDLTTFIPPREDLQYNGQVVVIVGPACASACEFFSYDMTLEDRAVIVGEYPTAGAGGSVEDFLMPEDQSIRMTIGRAVDGSGDIHIEGIGVVPDVRVPVTEENILARYRDGRDVALETAVDVVSNPRGAGVAADHPPTFTSDFDLIEAVQSGGTVIDDLARESYDADELSQAGRTYTYTIPLDRPSDLIWLTGWCTADQASFTDNWSKIRLRMTINGEEIALDRFGVFEGELQGNQCRFYYAQLGDWAVGESVLTAEVTFTAPLNDGFADYPAGTHVYEWRVFVAP